MARARRLSHYILHAAVLGLAGCSAEPAPPAPGNTGATATSAASATGVASAPAPGGPRRLDLPQGVCRIASAASQGNGARLRLKPGGAPFARAGSAGVLGVLGGSPGHRAEIVIPEGEPAAFGMAFETELVRVRGFVDPNEVNLHVAKPAVVAGFLVPVRVRVVRASADSIEVEPQFGKALSFVGALVKQRLSCADLSVDDLLVDVTAALPAAKKKDDYMRWKEGAPISISVEPDGPAVAQLRPATPAGMVVVLERKGRATRVAWHADGGAVFGWVASSALEQMGTRGRARGDEGTMGAPGERAVLVASVTCTADVALVAEVEGDQAEAGEIRAGAPIDVVERKDGMARVKPPARQGGLLGSMAPAVAWAEGASLWVRQRDIEKCTEAPKPR